MQATTTETSSETSLGRFSVRSLMVWTLLVALPLACFRQYYALASDTVDLRTQPLLQASPVAIVFFACGVISILAIATSLAIRRRFVSVAALLTLISLGVAIGYPWLITGLVSPSNGDPQAAQLHNDAAAVTAIALKFYYQRNGDWPKSWSELDQCLDEALAARQTRSKNEVNGVPSFLQDLNIERLPKLVDIDFEASPLQLSKLTWFEFTGIRPHKPSYNFYREEFQELIDTLAKQNRTE